MGNRELSCGGQNGSRADALVRGWFVVGLVAAVATVVAAGCGGVEDERSSQAFSARVTAICDDLKRKVEALEFKAESLYTSAEESDQEAIEQLEGSYAEFVPLMNAALEELRKLPAPKGGAEAIGEFLFAFERLVMQTRADLRALRSRQPRALRGFGNFSERHSREINAVTAAAAAGFRCSAVHAPPHY